MICLRRAGFWPPPHSAPPHQQAHADDQGPKDVRLTLVVGSNKGCEIGDWYFPGSSDAAKILDRHRNELQPTDSQFEP
jgi:hypothetical protein